MGGDVCVVHVSRVFRGGGGGHGKNLVPAGMFNGHLAHAWRLWCLFHWPGAHLGWSKDNTGRCGCE